jgi:benzoate 4-monooxygenase
MYYLLRNPASLQRLREELDTALVDIDVVAPHSLVRNLPYLRACLDESLRLSPPVPFSLNRKTPPDGAKIDNQWIPGGTTVDVPAYTAHRNPDFFPEPEAFRPERWFEEGAKAAQTSFIPFSAGARGCIGRNLTYMEQTMLIASLIHRYDFKMLNEMRELTWEEGFNLWPGPMPLLISRRT